jgi:hypothetical protein
VPSKQLITPKYCESINQTKRRPTRTIEVCRWRGRRANGRGLRRCGRRPQRQRRPRAARAHPRRCAARGLAAPRAMPQPPGGCALLHTRL